MIRRPADRGFTIIESAVSIALVAIVMTAVTSFYVVNSRVGRQQNNTDVAAAVAVAGLSRVRGIRGSSLTYGRDAAGSDAQWKSPVPGVAHYLDDTIQAWDATAAPGSGTTAPLPTGVQSTVVAGIGYDTRWYLGQCWQSLAGGCDKTQGTGGFLMFRVVVAVTWPDAACPAALCSYVTATLVSATNDPVFGLTAIPLPSVTVTLTPVPTVTSAPTTTTPTPGPLPEAIWSATKFSIASASVTITGTVHSNKDIAITGSVGTINPKIEYGGTYAKDLSSVTMTVPAATKAAATTPVFRAVADYLPGGSAATAAGSTYRAISCAAGTTWAYSAAQVGSATIVYVPCNVSLASASGAVTALIVADGTINVGSSAITIGNSAKPSATGLISNSSANPAITIAGSSTTVYGAIQALNGGVSISGSIADLRCGVVADSVSMSNNVVKVTVDASCAA